MTQQYAAIGTDGTRPVVWGLGESPEAAMADGLDELEPFMTELDGKSEDLMTLPITDEQARRVVDEGEVSTEALGIELPAAWLAEHQGK